MVNPRGFIEISRIEGGYRPVEERVQDYDEIELMLSEDERRLQASRCMDCGIPFCHWACPVENVMPEWQAKIAQGDWYGAYQILQSTNNFPEFTGRVCPAPCEVSCVLSINDDPVTIEKMNYLSLKELSKRVMFRQIPRKHEQANGLPSSVVDPRVLPVLIS
jgi:glutamate synthase (NADPH/NADH) small chain